MNLQSRRNKPHAEVFTAALNDIMFFLMLFFIIISTLLNPSIIKLNLPSAKNSQSIQKKEIQLSVNKELQYFIDNKQVAFQQIESVLATEMASDREAFVVIRCDNSLSVQELVNLLEIGNKLKIKMILATRKK
ncbi:MAG: ExbD/TolR family protein [Paludibacter sp.]